MANLEGFRCYTCGEWHERIPLDYGYSYPHYWSHDLKSRPNCFLNEDFCVIRKLDCFVRGLMEIPIDKGAQVFRYGAWVSLSEKNSGRMVELWHDAKLLNEPAYLGWLSNSIDLYPETLNLKCQVSSRAVSERPFITLETSEHPL